MKKDHEAKALKKKQKLEEKNKKIEDRIRKRQQKRDEKIERGNYSEKFLSLFRFNIRFKLTLGFIFKVIMWMALINMVVYVGLKGWMYYDASKDLSSAQDLVKESLSSEKDIATYEDVFEFNHIQYYIYTENDLSVLKTNDIVDVPYRQHQVAIDISKLVIFNYPNWFSYESGYAVDGQNYTIITRMNASAYHDDLNQIMSVSGIISVIVILLLWLDALRLTKKHLRPLRVMTHKVQDISVNNLDTRLDVSGTKDELKDLSKTFNKMMDEIESSYEKQRQFVSDASHELRTPIAVIKGYASMINRWGKEDESVLEESMHAIEEEAKNMQSLVESLLFLARRDKGSLEMDMSQFNIKEFLEEVVRETNLIDSDHNIIEQLEYDGEIYASPDKLKQAIRIFVDNSIKYTEKEKNITIQLKATENDIYIVIKDEGIGISKEDLPYIFERFYRADEARTRGKSGGTGLGLAIAKVVVEQHNGKILVDSEENVGTEVTIILPKLQKKNKTKK